MNQDNLFEILHGPEVEQSELEQICGDHFKSSMGLSSSEITYPGRVKDYALRLIYDRNRLAEIIPGPALTAVDANTLRSRIETELLTPGGARVGRVILFSSVPVTGCFRYENLFQLVPVPPEAPRPAFTMGEHPLLLEFSFRTSQTHRFAMYGVRVWSENLSFWSPGCLNLGFALMAGWLVTTGCYLSKPLRSHGGVSTFKKCIHGRDWCWRTTISPTRGRFRD